MKKKLIALLMAGALSLTTLTACETPSTDGKEPKDPESSTAATVTTELTGADKEKEELALAISLTLVHNGIDYEVISKETAYVWDCIGWYNAIINTVNLTNNGFTEEEVVTLQSVITNGEYIPCPDGLLENELITKTEKDGVTSYSFDYFRDAFNNTFGQYYSYTSSKNSEGSIVIVLSEYIEDIEFISEYTYDFTDNGTGAEKYGYYISGVGFNDLTKMYEPKGSVASFTTDDLIDANDMYALVDKYNAVKTTTDSYGTHTTTYFKRDGKYTSIWEATYENGAMEFGGNYNEFSYSSDGTSITAYTTIDLLMGVYENDLYSGYRYVFEYGTPYVFEETEDYYKFEIISEYSYEGSSIPVYTVSKDDLRLLTVEYSDYTFEVTYENVVPDEHNALDGWKEDLRKVTYVLDETVSSASMKQEITVEVPENWYLCIDEYYTYEYADENLSVPFEYPGDNTGDYTIYVSYAVG